MSPRYHTWTALLLGASLLAVASFPHVLRAQSLTVSNKQALHEPFDRLIYPQAAGKNGSQMPGIQTNLLANAGAYMVNPMLYDGTTSAAPISQTQWQALAVQLEAADVHYTGTAPSWSSIHSSLTSSANAGKVMMGGLFFDYDYIHPSDIGSGKDLQVVYEPDNTQSIEYIGPGNGHVPFRQDFVAAFGIASANTAIRAGSPVTFRINSANLYKSPGFGSIHVEEVDFGDGQGSQLVHTNHNYTVTYQNPGTYTGSALMFTSRGAVYAKFEVTVAPPASSGTCSSGQGRTPDFESGQLTSQDTYTATHPGGPSIGSYAGTRGGTYCYAVYYAGGNTTGSLQNPVVFVEGIDLSPLAPLTGQATFGGELRPDDLYETYLDMENGANFGDQLRLNGYDVVILDYGDALDFVQRNAMTVVDLIDRVNSELQGSNIEAVISYSMGGLATRYALTYMEHHGRAHNVESFFSYDGAHQGGYVPMGLQQMIDDIVFHTLPGKILSATGIAGLYVDYANSPAIRQLMAVNMLSSSVGYKSTQTGDDYTKDPLKLQFYSQLNAIGNHPEQVGESVAIVKGSATGANQARYNSSGSASGTLDPGERLMRTRFGIRILGIGVEADLNAYALPSVNSGARDIFKRIDKSCVFWCSTNTSRLRKDASYLGGNRPFDSSPGGNVPVLRSLSEVNFNKGTSGLLRAVLYPLLIVDAQLNIANTDFSFVQSASALDVFPQGSNASQFAATTFRAQDLEQSIHAMPSVQARTWFDDQWLVPANAAPSEQNQGHTAITTDIASFIVTKMGVANFNGAVFANHSTLPARSSLSGTTTVATGKTLTIPSGGEATIRDQVLLGSTSARLRVYGQLTIDDQALVQGGTIRVENGGTLIVKPGAVIEFEGGTGLYSRGQVFVQGVPGARVTIRQKPGSSAPQHSYAVYLAGSGADGSTVSYADVSGSRYGVHTAHADATLNHVSATGHYYHGAKIAGGSTTINYSSFEGNTYHGMFASGGFARINNSSFSNNQHTGVTAGYASSVHFGNTWSPSNSEVRDNDYGGVNVYSNASMTLGDWNPGQSNSQCTTLGCPIYGGQVRLQGNGKGVNPTRNATVQDGSILAELVYWGSQHTPTGLHVNSGGSINSACHLFVAEDYEFNDCSSYGGGFFSKAGGSAPARTRSASSAAGAPTERTSVEAIGTIYRSDPAEARHALKEIVREGTLQEARQALILFLSSEAREAPQTYLRPVRRLVEKRGRGRASLPGVGMLASDLVDDAFKRDLALWAFGIAVATESDPGTAQWALDFVAGHKTEPAPGEIESLRDELELAFPEASETVIAVDQGDALSADEGPLDLGATTYPNPSRGAVTLAITSPSDVRGSVEVFDLLGRSVAQIPDVSVRTGRTPVALDLAHLPAGVYAYRASVGTDVLSGRIVIAD